jgi:Nucleotide modification associated domain 2
MSKFYYYKLTVDDGGAPCITNDLLSLAICKPMIRGTAKIGDLIFGFAANSLDKDNRLIYVACVTNKLCDGEYYKDTQYAQRSDCIYSLKGNSYVWKSGSLYHGRSKDLDHDLGEYPKYPRANVLLSSDFRYFGKAGSDEYKSQFPLVWEAVKHLGQGHRVWHDPALYDELRRLKEWVWQNNQKKKVGEPTNKPSRTICHRSKSCGVVEKKGRKGHKSN